MSKQLEAFLKGKAQGRPVPGLGLPLNQPFAAHHPQALNPIQGVVAKVAPASVSDICIRSILPASPVSALMNKGKAPQARETPVAAVPKREAPRKEAPRRVSDEEVAEKAEALLRKGGLWRDTDINAEIQVGVDAIGRALKALASRRRAVCVAMGHWRSSIHPADLAVEGRTLGARILGLLLHGLPVPMAELAERLEISLTQVQDHSRGLQRQGLCEDVCQDVVCCPDAVRAQVVPLLGPEAPSPLGMRVLETLLEFGVPSRKIEISTKIGIGRGSGSKIIDVLVEDGWLVKDEEARYWIA